MYFGLTSFQSGGRLLGVMRPDGTYEAVNQPSRRHGYYEPETMPVVGPVTPGPPSTETNRIQDAVRGVDNWLRDRTGMGLMDGRPDVPDVIQNPITSVGNSIRDWMDEHIVGNTIRAIYVVFGIILIAVALSIMSKNQ